jgi:hypothetical protein
MPAPRIATDFPTPTFGGQSSGRGDNMLDGGSGCGARFDAAEDEPQPAIVAPIPIAAIARNMAEPPTALPIPARNSRRPIPGILSDIR